MNPDTNNKNKNTDSNRNDNNDIDLDYDNDNDADLENISINKDHQYIPKAHQYSSEKELDSIDFLVPE